MNVKSTSKNLKALKVGESISKNFNPLTKQVIDASDSKSASIKLGKNKSYQTKAAKEHTKLEVTQDESASSGSPSGSSNFSNWYAQASNLTEPGVASDTPISSAISVNTPKDLAQPNSAATEPLEPGALSTTAWFTLGLIGAGGIAAAIISSSKTSSTSSDTTAPIIQSISAHSETRTVELIYSEKLSASSLPLPSSFSVVTNGVANTVSNVTVNNNALTLYLTNSFTSGDIRITYTDPTSGNDGNAIQDISGNDASGFIEGVVADGYINGAQIYLDTNGNGYADPNEATGIYTNADGSFFLPSTLPNVAIIAVGGINIDTGLEQLTPLKAPAGSSVINPLTTLVLATFEHAQKLGEAITVEDAASTVARSLGLTLPSGALLTSFDPLANSDADSLFTQKAAAQIATLINLTAASDAQIAQTIMGNLASQLATTEDQSIDLAALDSSSLTALLVNTGVQNSNVISSQIAATNTAIKNADNTQAVSLAQCIAGDSSALTTRFAEETIVDNIPPVAALLSLASDTGRSAVDGISNNGLIKISFDHSQSTAETTTWLYSLNRGNTWLEGSGESFFLPQGSYARGAILVKELDAAGNTTVNTFDGSLTIDKTAWHSILSFEDDGYSDDDNIIIGDSVTGKGQINVALPEDADSWTYSSDYGNTWVTTVAGADSFTLAQNTYGKGAIQVKATDMAGNSSVTPLGTALIIDATLANTVPSENPNQETSPPTLLFVIKESDTCLKLCFDQEIDPDNPLIAAAFTIINTNSPSEDIIISSIEVNGEEILLNLLNAPLGDTTLSVAYDPGVDTTTAIQDLAGNDAAAFTRSFSNNSVLPYIEKFADTFITKASDLQFPIMGSFDVSDLRVSLLNQIQTNFSELTSSALATSLSAMSLQSFSTPALGWTSTLAEDIFDINYTEKTFTIKFAGAYNFGDVQIANGLGFDLGSENSLVKLGLNIDAKMATLWDIDLNLSGGWNANPLSTDFDIWLDETIIDQNNDPLSGSYISTSISADLSADSSISGNLGPLTTKAENTTTENTIFDTDISNAEVGTGLLGFVNVILTDPDDIPGYNFSNLLDIANNYQDAFGVHYGVNSQLSLEVLTGLDFNSEIDQVLPQLSFDLFAPFDLEFFDTSRVMLSEDQQTNNLSAFNNANNNGWIYLDNITVEVGDLINTIFDPILSFVDPVIQDLEPIVDFLQFDLIADLKNNGTGKDWFSELIGNVTDVINWLPGPDINLPTPIPTANSFVSNLLLDLYDEVNTKVGETGKVRVIDLIEGVLGQMNDALPALEKASKSIGGIAESAYTTVKDLIPYLETSVVVMREVSNFLSSYYDFVEAKSELTRDQYTLNLGTLAINIDPLITSTFSDRIDTSHLVMPWALNNTENISPNSDFQLLSVQGVGVESLTTQSTTETPWQQVIDIGAKIGIELPFLKDPLQFAGLLMNEPADLITFKPDFTAMIKDGLGGMVNTDIQLFDLLDVAASIPALSFLLPVTKIVDIPFKIRPDISITPRIEAGIDNYAILNRDDPSISKWDGLYLSDNHITNAKGELVDLPELEASLGLAFKAFLGVGVRDVFYADVGAGVALSSDWALNLDDSNNDGKVRGSEILNAPDFSGSADWLVQIYGNLDTFWKDTSITYTAHQDNLFKFDTQSIIPA